MISIGNLQINKLCLGDVEVTKAYLGDVEVYGSTKKYMTITVLDGDAGTDISPTITGTLSPNLQYRVNNGSWNDFIVGTTADIHAVAGDVVQFKGVNESGISTSNKNYLNFSISGNSVALSGNVMSLIDGVGDALAVPNYYCFYYLFKNSKIKTVSSDFLPATTLKSSCYRYMFYNCTSLVNAPVLPATTLAGICYSGMFQGCTSLTKAPELPATTISERCYESMFNGCTSLTTAPVLPATTLADSCYYNMFNGCTSLTQAPVLPATTLANECYFLMLGRCTALTQAPALPATTLAPYCYQGMFSDCTALTKAPELPAVTLKEHCYFNMFYGCKSLNYVKCLATDITASVALYNWLNGVATTGTFVKRSGVSYETGASGIPNGWTVQNI